MINSKLRKILKVTRSATTSDLLGTRFMVHLRRLATRLRQINLLSTHWQVLHISFLSLASHFGLAYEAR